MALGVFAGSEPAAGNGALSAAKRFVGWVFSAFLIPLVTAGCEGCSRRELPVPNDQ